ncbi:hypothetical protein AURANDRAFT_67686 [Aureococcus anophagefferens]|uniref:RING-type domain-containing protein n=1 Tax=Aureococcus anophagefferens TaxID=44056 RepID=F0YM22_AURAN|nr:hypothetical protein AURANDRAFT_67686 [Aureococcus anophagefferens]EGB03838.1 hypothetical protein AURANDRAFT_67686 [Aureococcus anophagefferens]|eukprot:XP_009041496.1 hypothetical protein AURANDRAFT_67686 [Aureococcus anophagefferens]
MDEEKQRVMEAERREIEETEKRLNDLGTVLNSEDDDDESALNSDDETEDIEGKAWFEVGEHYVDKEDMWSKTFGDCKHCCSEKEYLEQTQNEDDKNHLLRLRGGGDNEDDEDLPSYSDSDEDDLICPRCGKIANVPNRMGQLCPSSQDCGQMICRACLDDMTHSREMFCPPCWQRNLDLDFRPSSYEEYSQARSKKEKPKDTAVFFVPADKRSYMSCMPPFLQNSSLLSIVIPCSMPGMHRCPVPGVGPGVGTVRGVGGGRGGTRFPWPRISKYP